MAFACAASHIYFQVGVSSEIPPPAGVITFRPSVQILPLNTPRLAFTEVFFITRVNMNFHEDLYVSNGECGVSSAAQAGCCCAATRAPNSPDRAHPLLSSPSICHSFRRKESLRDFVRLHGRPIGRTATSRPGGHSLLRCAAQRLRAQASWTDAQPGCNPLRINNSSGCAARLHFEGCLLGLCNFGCT